jgi:hypothetical protein
MVAGRHPTLLDSFEYEGYWWLPENSENRVPGALSFDPDGGISLHLMGSLHMDERRPHEIRHDPLVILGQTTPEAMPVTLLRCHREQIRLRLPNFSHSSSRYEAEILLVGSHYESLETVHFNSLSANYTNLEEWLSVVPFALDFPRNEEGRLSVEARYVPTHLADIPIPAIDSVICIRSGFSQSGDTFRSIMLENTAFFDIQPNDPCPLDWFLEQTQFLQQLLAVLVGEPVYARRLVDLDEETSPWGIRIYYRTGFVSSQRSVHPATMTFSAHSIGEGRLPDILRLWFERRESIALLSDLLLGVEYSSPTFLEFELLAYTQALEGFHRQRFGGEYLPRETYRLCYYDRLVAAIPGELPEEMRRSLETSLSYSYQFSLRTRLQALMGNLSTPLQQLIAEDRRDFIDAVVRTRNYIAHRDEEERERTLSGGSLYWANVRLALWITILILRELGISGDDIVEGVQRSRRFQYLIQNRPDGR